ncbi:MAG: Gfo/Idh/MocA family oxidoreductase [Planctomycetota bacterium]
MKHSTPLSDRDVSRRTFIQGASAAMAGATVAAQAPLVHAGGSDGIRIGLIGCGGRGTGALLNAVGAATNVIYPAEGYHTEDASEGAAAQKKDVQVVALADLFADRLERCRRNLRRIDRQIADDQCYLGFDAYERLLANPDVNYVILATPPHFRPTQLMAAIQAGKHVFMEKPAAVDVPGIRTVMEAGRLANEKGLGIGAGTQRRHTPGYRETIRRLHDGAIGDVVFAKCYWNGGQIWVVSREPGWSDVEWQIRNWNHFTWLSGDHIVEQHVHNLDVVNWALQAHPIKAVSGLGGRQVRTGERHGQIYDHFAVEYEYPGGVNVFSQCRQINGCKSMVGEFVVGSAGKSNCSDYIEPQSGASWKYDQRDPNPLVLEHENLIASIRAGEPINEAQAIAESTMTAILGREAVYSGQEITWGDAMESDTRLGPDNYEFGPYPVAPVAMPGKYEFS